jgi:hypothetical protein
MTLVVLLGPQGAAPTVGKAVQELGLGGPIATITAGWQEWEGEDARLREQLGTDTLPLRLYARAEQVWAADPALRNAHRRMQQDLRTLRGLYDRQLERAAEVWIELLSAEGPERLLVPERDAALAAIQRLDAHHIARVEDLRSDFEAELEPLMRPALREAREAILSQLETVQTVVIEGGHAAVLHNRLALFGLAEALAEKSVIGCAAGAMLLTRRVLLFNDSPAIGRGHAEVGLPGLGLVPGLVVLPDAARRLRVDDPERMRRLALRVAPDRCALLDHGDRLYWDGTSLSAVGARTVEHDGAISGWAHAA